MSQIRRYRPSPAMIVALMALVVATAGTASGLPGHARVRSDDIARQAIKTRHIANGAVTRQKLAKGVLNSMVPDAQKLDNRDTGSSLPATASPLRTFNVAMNRGDTPKTVATIGPFTLTGRCENDAAKPGHIAAVLQATTGAPSSYFSSDAETDNDWNPGEVRLVNALSALPGARAEASSQLKLFNPDSDVYTYMSDGEPIGLLVGFQGAECRFIGHVVVYG